MRTRALFRLLLLLASPAALAWAQGGVPADPIKVIDSQGRPRGGAVVTFCTSAGSGVPCTPLASVFLDAGLTTPATNPMSTDGLGNLPTVYSAPGTYKYTVTGIGITTAGQPFTVQVSGDMALAGAQTVTGTKTFAQQIISTVTTGTAPFSIASTTVVPNLNAQLHNGLTAPGSAIVGISDTQTLTNKTLTSPTINNPTLDGFGAAHAATQTSAATNFGTNLSSQTLLSSAPSTSEAYVQVQVVQTLAGVGCSATSNTVQITITYTAPGGTVISRNSGTYAITGNGSLDANLNSGPTGIFEVEPVKSGTNVTYTTTSTLASTGCSTVPQYTVFAKAFF